MLKLSACVSVPAVTALFTLTFDSTYELVIALPCTKAIAVC